MPSTQATFIGASAILMWSLLALLTIGSSPVPPLLLNALCFGLGGCLGLIWSLRGGIQKLRQVSWRVYAFGTAGLFGYHLLYFTAFRLSPSAETGLIAYLWPLFIVLFSGFLPGETLRARHILGALIAFAGAAILVLGRGEAAQSNSLGLFLAFGCALCWSGYSVISRRLGDVPTESVTIFCLAAAVLSALCHLAFEETLWPADAKGWLSVLLLGLGPVGAAFFTWDIGMKRGDIQLLGVASYAAPLLSTLALVGAGFAEPSLGLLIAAILITTGALVAAKTKARQAP